MKKKRIVIAGVAVVASLCVLLGVSKIASLKITAADSKEVFHQKSQDDDTWKIIENEVKIENDNLIFSMDGSNTHFSVTDKNTGKVFYSVPQKTASFEPNEEQQSELIVNYYDGNSLEMTMNSSENCIAGESFEVKTDGSAIRVYYSIQKSKTKIFVPTVISQETFENLILKQLESGPKRRLNGFYTLIKDKGYYELNSSAGEHNYSEITGYMEKAKYTAEDYAKEVEKLGVTDNVSENMPAAFLIPVEYTLTENGFSATVLTDKITSDSSNYTLTEVELLPYFGSCEYVDNGWMLVPDGSGAIIELAEKQGISYLQGLWGSDYAIEKSVNATIMQNAGLPVFAMHDCNKAFFAEITGAGAIASVAAETYGNEILQSHIHATFNVKAYDTSDMGAMRNQAVFNLYASSYVSEFPQVIYTLFGEDTTYSDMANSYREQLIQRGVLGERVEESDSKCVYLDFTGYETIDSSFMGISVDKDIVLSTLEEIEASLEELEKRGVSDVSVRLKAYANGGIYNKVSNGFEMNKKVGSIKELQELASLLTENGGTLYLDNNISTVYEQGKSFKKMTHAVRSLKKTVLNATDYDLVARTKAEVANEFFLLSPAYFDSLTENFTKGLAKEIDDISVLGYSWSDFGSKLYSDFHTTTPYDRAQSMYAAVSAMEKADETFSQCITDGSNSYVLSEVSTVLNIPLSSSDLTCESYSVPFYQMVIHGYKHYAGAPVNTGGDTERTYLESIESGANLYYSFYTTDKEVLKETKVGTLIYPTYMGASFETIEEQYQTFTELFADLQAQTIISHERVTDQVFVTTYEDGTKIAVNYNEKAIEVKGQDIPAKGFCTWKGGESK